MRFYQVDPLQDVRWSELVDRHPKASVFHTSAWLKALRSTYGYEPVVFTTSPPTGELKNGLVFCRVRSWLTGHRLVSLPFADHCEPLSDLPQDIQFLVSYLQTVLEHEEWKYLELRPIDGDFGNGREGLHFVAAKRFFLHSVDLHSDRETLFSRLHKDSVQRRIQRAERAGLIERCGRTDDLLEHFYAMFVKTRSRHQIPPIPYVWFRNLIQCNGEGLQIRVAYSGRTPIAGILTLQFRDVLYYKYGCSDVRFKGSGATPWLLWKALLDGKSKGATQFDLGRTDEDDEGLLAFKNHWDPQPRKLVYWKFPYTSFADSMDSWGLKLAKQFFSRMPSKLLTITGRLIYRHIG